MFRFAMSSSQEMNLNDLRIALLNYMVAKQQNKSLLVRFDDLQKQENIQGVEKQTLELLQLFSIDHLPAVYQYENMKKYLQMAMQLLINKKAFSCFCTTESLNKSPNKYNGHCDELQDHEVIDNEQPFTVRIKASDELDKFIILNHDKTPTSDFASAIDDMLFDISTVIIDEKFEQNCIHQTHIRKSLGYEKKINYIYVPALKSKQITIKSLIDDGYLPSAIANYLLSLGTQAPQEIFSLEEATQWFDISTLSNSQIEFDQEQLNHINQEHLKSLDDMRFSKILGYADNDIGKLAKVYTQHLCTIKQIKEKIDAIFQQKPYPKEFIDEYDLIKQTIIDAPFFQDFDQFKTYLSQKTNLDDKKLFKPLMYMLTGNYDGPHLDEIYPYIKNYLGEIVQ